ncbi:MAG: MoaD/ThiS family protein [Bacillota bacterium]
MPDLIRVKVKGYNLIWSALGGHDAEVTLAAPATFADLLDHLVRERGALAQVVLDGREGIRPNLRVFLNGRPLPNVSGPEQLNDGDEVIMLMAAAGG